MLNIPKNRVKDPREIIEPGIGVGRDPQRTPMQWNANEFAGFSSSEPWLPIAKNVKEINVEKQKQETGSLLSFYRKLIQLRQNEPALYAGDYFPAGIKDQLFCFTRKYKKSEFMVCFNLGKKEISFTTNFEWQGTIEIAKNLDKEGKVLNNTVQLAGYECVIIRLMTKKLIK